MSKNKTTIDNMTKNRRTNPHCDINTNTVCIYTGTVRKYIRGHRTLLI